MAKIKATIVYALTGGLVALNREAQEMRDRGAVIRLVSLNEFRGETETNAGSVYVERSDDDQSLFDAVQQAYPHLDIQDFGGFRSLDPFDQSQGDDMDGDLKSLRMRLVQLGGTVPAGASAGSLAALIVAQEAGLNRTPVLPSPGNQGTVIPDSTPTMAKTAADAAVDTAATGSTPAVIAANFEASGVDAGTGLQGDRAAGSTPGAQPGEDRAGANANADAGGEAMPRTHAELDAIASSEGIDFGSATTVADKQAAIAAARGE